MVLAYTHLGYILVGWILTVGVFVAFAAVTVRRGRHLSTVVPPEERRWS